MYLHPEMPSYEDQLKARDGLLERHPKLQFTGAHLASLEWSVDELAAFLEARETEEPADIPADLLSRFVAAGDSAGCAATIRDLLDAGAHRVVLVPNPAGFCTTAAMVDQIRAAAGLIERVGGGSH